MNAMIKNPELILSNLEPINMERNTASGWELKGLSWTTSEAAVNLILEADNKDQTSISITPKTTVSAPHFHKLIYPAGYIDGVTEALASRTNTRNRNQIMKNMRVELNEEYHPNTYVENDLNRTALYLDGYYDGTEAAFKGLIDGTNMIEKLSVLIENTRTPAYEW